MNEEDQKVIEEIKESGDFFQKARLVKYLQKEKKITTKKLSEALGIQPASLCHISRLNKLPEMVVDGYYAHLISISHLFIIARLKEQEQMILVYEKALAKNLTVLQTEELVREYLYQIKAGGDYIPRDQLKPLEESIKLKYKNTSVKVIQTRIQAKVILEVKGNLKTTSQTLRELMESLSK